MWVHFPGSGVGLAGETLLLVDALRLRWSAGATTEPYSAS
jgi:hypothetical protein